MVSETPGPTATMALSAPSARHIRPCPETKYQISSIEQWATGRETCPAGSEKTAALARAVRQRMNTSDPSGATASGAAPIALVCQLIVPTAGPLLRLARAGEG